MSMLSTTTPLQPVSSQESLPLDLLDRQQCLNSLEQVLNTLSKNRASCTFALTAPWGTGKTFVLNLLERRLLDYQGGTQYLVFQYNCWKYDYYSEPLIAIVASFLDYYDKATHLTPPETRQKARKAFAIAKSLLTDLAYGWVKNKTDVDLDRLLELWDTAVEAGEDAVKEAISQQSYDVYFAFQKALLASQKAIAELAQDRTVVIMVDELDRCLPEYAIRVLERLHHLFFGIENTLVLLSIDEGQLEHTVRQIFGHDTKTNDYLKKFIQFRFPLPTGRISGNFEEKYAPYFSLFNKDLIQTDFDFNNFFSALFAGIDIRTQERIMDRLETVHSIAFPVRAPEDRKDYSFLCFEVLWVVLKDVHQLSFEHLPIKYNSPSRTVNYCSLDQGSRAPDFDLYLKNIWRALNFHTTKEEGDLYTTHCLPTVPDIPHLILYYLQQLDPENPEQYILLPETVGSLRYHQNAADLESFVLLLHRIL